MTADDPVIQNLREPHLRPRNSFPLILTTNMNVIDSEDHLREKEG